MLGRYIAITLVGLGGAMFLAPDSADRAEEEARAPDPAPLERPADPAPREATRSVTVPSQEAPSSPVVQASVTREPEPAPPRPVETAETRAPATGSVPEAPAAPGSDALALSLLGSLSEDAALPTLETPSSVRDASVGADTLALISLSEGTAVAQIELPADAPANPEAEPVVASASVPGEEPSLLYVTGSRVNVREGPSTAFGVVSSLAFGDAVELIEETGTGWAEIRIADGSTGFMARRFLEE